MRKSRDALRAHDGRKQSFRKFNNCYMANCMQLCEMHRTYESYVRVSAEQNVECVCCFFGFIVPKFVFRHVSPKRIVIFRLLAQLKQSKPKISQPISCINRMCFDCLHAFLNVASIFFIIEFAAATIERKLIE